MAGLSPLGKINLKKNEYYLKPGKIMKLLKCMYDRIAKKYIFSDYYNRTVYLNGIINATFVLALKL
jgi:hypothetical protein